MTRRKKTDAEKRADLVYEAEWAAGTWILRPLLSVSEAQVYVDSVLRSRWWRNRTGIRAVKVTYVPRWERESEMEDRRTTGDMQLTLCNMCEGVVLHELAHCARGDVDNSHPKEYCEMLIGLIGERVNYYMADRLREALHLRKLI